MAIYMPDCMPTGKHRAFFFFLAGVYVCAWCSTCVGGPEASAGIEPCCATAPESGMVQSDRGYIAAM